MLSDFHFNLLYVKPRPKELKSRNSKMKAVSTYLCYCFFLSWIIYKTIQVRRTRHAGHCWRSKNELIGEVLLWTPTYGRAKAGRPARTYIQQLCEDTGYSPEDLPEAMNDREKWRERVRDIPATGTTWRWWWLWKIIIILLYHYNCPIVIMVRVFANCPWDRGSIPGLDVP